MCVYDTNLSFLIDTQVFHILTHTHTQYLVYISSTVVPNVFADLFSPTGFVDGEWTRIERETERYLRIQRVLACAYIIVYCLRA